MPAGPSETRAVASRVAKILLPATVWAETDGTFVNKQGKAQQSERALRSLGDSVPGWLLVAKVARAVPTAMRHGMAFLTEDRKDTGCFLILDVLENMQMALLNRSHVRAGFVDEGTVGYVW